MEKTLKGIKVAASDEARVDALDWSNGTVLMLVERIETLLASTNQQRTEVERQRAEIEALREALRQSAQDYDDCNNRAKGYIKAMRTPYNPQPAAVVETPAPPASGDTLTDEFRYHKYLVEAQAAGATPMTESQWMRHYGTKATEPTIDIRLGDLVEVINEGRYHHARGHVTEIDDGRYRVNFISNAFSWDYERFTAEELNVLAR